MPISIDKPALDARLDAIRDRLTVLPSRAALAEAILNNAATAFEATGDPEAWKYIPAPNGPPNGAQNNSGVANGSVQPSLPTASNGDSATTPRVNVASDPLP